MIRQMVLTCTGVVVLIGSASAQINRGGSGFAANGQGNTGGFTTGPGFSNSFQNSSNFGLNAPRYNYGVAAPSMQSIPGVSNYSGGYNTNLGMGTGQPGVGSAAFGVAPGGLLPGVTPGLVPGITPPGLTRDAYGNVGLAAGDTGYTNFGNALTASALGLGYGGLGYGPLNYGMGLGPIGATSFGPMGYTYPGMVPGAFLPGMGYMSPVDMAAATGINTSQTAQPSFQPAIATTMADGANSKANDAGGNASDGESKAARRSPLNDNVRMSTANAIRIQNRLHNIKSPNFKNVKVLITSRVASLSGTVESKADEQLAVRMVGLEPGVVEVKSELVVSD